MLVLPYILFFNLHFLKLFGSEFVNSEMCLKILSTGYLINMFIGPVAILLSMSKNYKVVAYSTLFTLLTNIVLNYILIQCYQMTGAAIATAVSMVMWKTIMFFYIKLKMSLDCSPIGILAVSSAKIDALK